MTTWGGRMIGICILDARIGTAMESADRLLFFAPSPRLNKIGILFFYSDFDLCK
jgi:hypothetical protein